MPAKPKPKPKKKPHPVFYPGHPKMGGRQKGTLNKFTTLKQAFLQAFEKLGGVDGLVRWAQTDEHGEKVFYTLLARMLPREVVVAGTDEVQPGNLRGLKDEELDDLLKRHLKSTGDIKPRAKRKSA